MHKHGIPLASSVLFAVRAAADLFTEMNTQRRTFSSNDPRTIFSHISRKNLGDFDEDRVRTDEFSAVTGLTTRWKAPDSLRILNLKVRGHQKGNQNCNRELPESADHSAASASSSSVLSFCMKTSIESATWAAVGGILLLRFQTVSLESSPYTLSRSKKHGLIYAAVRLQMVETFLSAMRPTSKNPNNDNS